MTTESQWIFLLTSGKANLSWAWRREPYPSEPVVAAVQATVTEERQSRPISHRRRWRSRRTAICMCSTPGPAAFAESMDRRRAMPAIAAGGIVNAASLAGGAIAAGELISIFGSDFGPSGLDVAALQNNVVPKALSNVHVYFGLGNEGAITARSGDTNQRVRSLRCCKRYFHPSDRGRRRHHFRSSHRSRRTLGFRPLDRRLQRNGTRRHLESRRHLQQPLESSEARNHRDGCSARAKGSTTPALPDGALEISTPYSATQAPVVC